MTKRASDSTAPQEGFAALGLDRQLIETLTALGYEEPTPIQQQTIPPLLAGRDVLGQAATGTGKTAAFALPLLQQLVQQGKRPARSPSTVRALILVPTRELAIQVSEAVYRYGRSIDARVLAVYGGQAIQPQLAGLRRGVDVVVATPGRALDHIRRGSMVLDQVRMLILDEADEMLDMGFAEDLEAILSTVPEGRQTALFSATIPRHISALVDRHLRDPVRVQIARERVAAGEVPRIRQAAYIVHRRDKIAALGRVLDAENPTSTLVFCRMRNEVDELTETLAARGYRPEAIHGGRSQQQRDSVMRRFRDGSIDLLIATDVAARGLDIGHLSHVINFDVPCSTDAYVHRIGRTGRAGRSGAAITLLEPREHRLLRNIELAIKQRIPVQPVPTVADLRARRLEMTRASLRELLVGGKLDDYRVVVDSLADEYDVLDIATAAVKLAHQANSTGNGTDEAEAEITPVSLRPPAATTSVFRSPRQRAAQAPGRWEDSPRTAPARRPSDVPARAAAPTSPNRRERRAAERAARGGATHPEASQPTAVPSSPPPARRSRAAAASAPWNDKVRLHISVGRSAGARPADIVGAIANEAGLSGRAIGAIEIADDFSVVEVPAEVAEEIIHRMRRTFIRGKRAGVRLDEE